MSHGALADVPVWSSRPRATNWAATVTSVSSPDAGRYNRQFWSPGFQPPGNDLAGACGYYFLPAYLDTGHVVVFATDETDTDERRRYYGVVIALTSTGITIAEYPSVEEAWAAALELPATPPIRDSGDLVELRDALLDALGLGGRPLSPVRLTAALRGVVRATKTLPTVIAADILTGIDHELHWHD